MKEKVKALSDDLRAERQLTLKKDEQLLGVKESLKTIAARSVEAFQTTDEYNSVLRLLTSTTQCSSAGISKASNS